MDSDTSILTRSTLNLQNKDARIAKKPARILLIADSKIDITSNFLHRGISVSSSNIERALEEARRIMPEAILVSSKLEGVLKNHIEDLRNYAIRKCIPFILYASSLNRITKSITTKFGFDDCYCGDLSPELMKKIQLIKKMKEYKRKRRDKTSSLKIGDKPSGMELLTAKRIVDIIVSSLLLLCLLPFFLIIALIIKLESRGPVFYVSKRAGNGYKIFDFYKFRSMRKGAEKELKNLASHNQYGKGAFYKIINDPRITRFGSFMRNTSIDELPQLFNVLKGDMSLVGNRPLPLYEAEQLTKDTTACRFLAPAGITGLWQITKRGKSELTEEERIKLDLTYAKKYSFLYDMKILLGTLPALIQKERV